MIIIQETFVCKPGNASKVAKSMKEAMTGYPNLLHILTDMTGQYHRVIVLSKFEDLTDYQKTMEEMQKNPSKEMKEAMAKMGDMQDMYVSGSREIYKVW